MKYLKLFENYELEKELVDDLSDNTINKYFDKHGGWGDTKELISMFPSYIWDHIDNKKYMDEYINNQINYTSIEDWEDKDDFKEFLNDNWNSKKEDKVLKIWRNKQYDSKKYKNKISKTDGIVTIIELENSDDIIIKVATDDKIKRYKVPEEHKILVKEGQHVNIGDKLSILEYEEYMFDDLDENELKEVIKDSNEESDYVEFAVRKRYNGYDAKELIEELYGNISDMKSEDLYNLVQWYIDEDAIEKEYKDDQDFTNRKEFVQNELDRSVQLQNKILKVNKSNVLKLAELLKDAGSSNTIENDYYFQKLYIQEYVKANKGDDKKGTLKATALKYLNDNFELDEDIENEYSKWTWLISADKYNV